jgi:RNA polymerase-binding protein DksA
VAKPAPKKITKKAVKPASKPVAKPTKAVQSKPAMKTPAKPVAKAIAKPPTKPIVTAKASARFARPEPAMAPPPIPVTPVPTNGKPRKNQAGISPRELENFRDLLLAKRREIVGDMSQMEREALRSAGGSNLSNLPLHMADMGTDNYEQEFTLGLVEKDRVLLREINQALAKIMDGTYGICEGTGKPISKVRLEAQPWARYSIEYARQKEKGFIR